MRTHRKMIVMLLPCLLLLAGCGPNVPEGFPKIYPVKLRLLQEGKPLDDASILLRSTDPAMNWSVGGKTDQNGLATLWTHGKFQGAPSGTFKVIVSKMVNEGEAEYFAALMREDKETAKKIEVKSYSLVEDQYESADTTPLKVEITPQTRTLDIDAGPAVKLARKYMK